MLMDISCVHSDFGCWERGLLERMLLKIRKLIIC